MGFDGADIRLVAGGVAREFQRSQQQGRIARCHVSGQCAGSLGMEQLEHPVFRHRPQLQPLLVACPLEQTGVKLPAANAAHIVLERCFAGRLAGGVVHHTGSTARAQLQHPQSHAGFGRGFVHILGVSLQRGMGRELRATLREQARQKTLSALGQCRHGVLCWQQPKQAAHQARATGIACQQHLHLRW